MILGIDPGTLRLGYGVLRGDGARWAAVAHGTVRTGGGDLPGRLRCVHEAVARLIDRYAPKAVALESAFFGLNAASALRLGEARGAVMVTAALAGIPVRQFAPARVKRSVTGSGRASKSQVAGMVVRLLGLRSRPAEDAADALAIALCASRGISRAGTGAPRARPDAPRRLRAVLT